MLGLVQGLTEWLPISSSAHLVLLQSFLSPGSVAFDALVHGGTMLSALLTFRSEVIGVIRGFLRSLPEIWLRRSFDLPYESRLAWYVIVGTLPVAFTGLLLADRVEASFNARVAAIGLLINGAILYSTKWSRGRDSLDLRRALLVGMAQSASLLPGISRSGSTIAIGLLAGLRREEAMSFSFLLSVPAIAGALTLEALRSPGEVMSLANLIGFLSSFSIGLVAIRSLVSLVRRGRLHLFSYYCLALGALALILAARA